MKPILVGNWKNHPSSLSEARKLLASLARRSRLFKKLSTFIAPPLAYMESVALRGLRIGALAAQDVFAAPAGTYTGEVTADILKSFGVRLAIVGHSERRALGESDQTVSEKVRAALSAGIVPLVCVGEREHDADGNYFEFLRAQLKASLAGVRGGSEAGRLMVAYEPVWAIGEKAKGAITPPELAQTVIFIRKVLTDMFGRAKAEKIPILYGGSVDAANAGALALGTGIKGFLVGRASLRAEDFAGIAETLTKR